MKQGDVFATPNNQHRFVLGFTPIGDVAFATRGGNVPWDFNQCQIQPLQKFLVQSKPLYVSNVTERNRVLAKFKAYATANAVKKSAKAKPKGSSASKTATKKSAAKKSVAKKGAIKKVAKSSTKQSGI